MSEVREKVDDWARWKCFEHAESDKPGLEVSGRPDLCRSLAKVSRSYRRVLKKACSFGR